MQVMPETRESAGGKSIAANDRAVVSEMDLVANHDLGRDHDSAFAQVNIAANHCTISLVEFASFRRRKVGKIDRVVAQLLKKLRIEKAGAFIGKGLGQSHVLQRK